MRSVFASPLSSRVSGRRVFGRIAFLAALLLSAVLSLTPARAAEIPSDDDQDVLVRTTLMTFNDANMTNIYSVMIAKSSKQFQAQITPEKLASSLEAFRTGKLFFEEIVTADYDSQEKAKIDPDGALVLAGVLKGDAWQVKYNLRFVMNETAWKLLGFNVDCKHL